MAYRDLREYITRLEEVGELKRIKVEVDWNLEIGAIMRRANDLREPALLFEKIKGYSGDYTILANLVGASKPNIFGRVCLARGLPIDMRPLESIDEIARRFQSPIKPVLVDKTKAPCKENIIMCDDIDLFKFPIPYLRQFDGGRYIGTWHTDITKDPDSGWVNW